MMRAAQAKRIVSALAALAAGLAISLGASAQGKPVVIGVANAQTGFLSDLAVGTQKGLELWVEQVNAAGGLLGRPVELKIVDDGSDATRSTELYEKLIKEDTADLLIGSFGSAATSMAAAVAERNRRVMINASGPSAEIHRRVYRYLFQVPPPSDKTLAGVLPIAEKFGLKTVTVTARDDGQAAPLLEQLRRDAVKRTVEIRPPMPFQPDPVLALVPFAKRLASSNPDVIVSPATAHDAADLLRGLKAAGYTPRLFVAGGVIQPDYIRLVGQDAEYSVGYSSYEPRAKTPGNAEFVRAYRAKYSRVPDFHAASAWAAGKVIEAAVAKAGTLDQENLRAAFAAVELHTVLGGYKVAADGSQLAATAFLVQILKGRREVIWPEAYRSAEPVLPAPDWNRRKPL